MLSVIRSCVPRGLRLRTAAQGIRVCSYHGLVQTRQDNRLERNFHLASDFAKALRSLPQ